MTDAPRPWPPVPTSVSERARQFLSVPARTAAPPPALDDTDGWLQRVAEGDNYLVERFSGQEFPVTVDETEIGGVRTYVL